MAREFVDGDRHTSRLILRVTYTELMWDVDSNVNKKEKTSLRSINYA